SSRARRPAARWHKLNPGQKSRAKRVEESREAVFREEHGHLCWCRLLQSSPCTAYPRISMFSYRHAFHAGNHADVLKHMVLIQLLDYMKQKEGPLMFVDTHAGAGIYSLEGGQAAKTAEYAS